jgi:hypothetical protein
MQLVDYSYSVCVGSPVTVSWHLVLNQRRLGHASRSLNMNMTHPTRWHLVVTIPNHVCY